ncbi:MAG TPA: hypothetical protein PLK12_00565 [Prolixibacteraceae bacterium]|nr:hypothetical protein [Prolixibacteraceae bacterium]
MKKSIVYITLGLLVFSQGLKAQIDIQGQLNEISPMVSDYMDFYFYDLSNYQGDIYQNSINYSGDVLGQWEMKIALNAGIAFKPVYSANVLRHSNNFELNGDDPNLYAFGPNMFSNLDEAELFFRFTDPITNGAVYDPFTGEKVGFSIPVFEGMGTGMTFSPAVMPVISLGVGFGTELSVGIMPGAIQSLGVSIPGDFTIASDLSYIGALKHDIFHWIRPLAERDYHLTLGVNYASFDMGIAPQSENGLFKSDQSQRDYYYFDDNFEGIDFHTGALGFELMATKEFKWVDLSLFASMNQAEYSIKSVGDIVFHINTSFKAGSADEFKTYTVSDYVNVNKSFSSLLYGAAVKFHFGGFNLGAKYAYKGGTGQGSHFVSTTLGFAFDLKKKKAE